MSTFSKVTLNTLASFLGRLASGVLAIISISFIARGLGVEGFGEYSTIIAYLGIFQILADFGLYSLLTREISQNSQKETQLISYFFTLRLLLVLGFLVFGSLLVFLFPYSFNIKLGVIFSASAFIFLSLNQIFLGIFQKYLQTYKVALSEFIGRILQLTVVWIAFKYSSGLFNYLSAMMLAAFSMFLINTVFIRKLVKFHLVFNAEYAKKIFKQTLPIAASLVFTLLYFKIDIILLSFFKTQEDVGIYSTATRVLEAVIFFPTAFIGIIFPILSKYAKENLEKLANFLSGLGNLITIVVLPVLVSGIFFSSTIIHFIGGKEFLAAAPVLSILFLAICIIFYGTLFGNAIIALDLQKKAMWAYAFSFVFNLVTNIIFIPRYSYFGAAWTTVLTEFIVTVWLILLVKKYSGFKFSFKITTKALFASVLMATSLLYFVGATKSPLILSKFLLAVIIGATVYFVGFFITRLNRQVMLFFKKTL